MIGVVSLLGRKDSVRFIFISFIHGGEGVMIHMGCSFLMVPDKSKLAFWSTVFMSWLEVRLFCVLLADRSKVFFFLIRHEVGVCEILSMLGIGLDRNASEANLKPAL